MGRKQAGRCRPACVNRFEVRTSSPSPFRLRLVLLRLVGGVEGVLQGDEVFARLQRVQDGLLGLELLGGVVGGLDGQADAPVALVNLDDARGDFLADLEHVLDLVDALLADLRDVHQAVNLMLQADERAEAGQLGDVAGDEVADLVELVDAVPRIGARAA